MDELNPYAPPRSDPLLPVSEDAEPPLASPWLRLVAVIIDTIIVSTILFPLEWTTHSLRETVTTHATGVTVSYHLADTWQWTLAGFGIWTAINWAFLRQGQTIGKKLLILQVRRKSGARAEVQRLILHRRLIITLLEMIPVLGVLIRVLDVLMIFRSEHNTLHDDIADTKVVRLTR